MFIKLKFKKQKTFEAVQETCELQCSNGQGGFQSSQDAAYPTTRQSRKSPIINQSIKLISSEKDLTILSY